MSRVTTAAFVGSLAVITWRELNNPPAGAPLPLPTPSRYVGAAIVFGILEFMSDIWNPRISDVLAAGFFLTLAISTAQNGIQHNASSGNSNSPGNGATTVPNGGSGIPGLPSNPGLLTGPGFLPPDNGGLVPAPGGQ